MEVLIMVDYTLWCGIEKDVVFPPQFTVNYLFYWTVVYICYLFNESHKIAVLASHISILILILLLVGCFQVWDHY